MQLFAYGTPFWRKDKIYFHDEQWGFYYGNQWGIKFVILVEESDTGGPSLITIRLEYLLYNSDVVNLVWESNKREAGSIIVNFCYMGVL